MKRSIAILLCVAAAVLGLAGGYALRFSTEGKPVVSAEGDKASAKAGAPRAKAVQRETSHALLVKSNAERSKGSHHWLQWMSGVESASLEELAGLARMAKGNSGALRMIAFRWVELDPQHFFDTLMKESEKSLDEDAPGAFPLRELTRYLFEEWPKHDSEAAIAALSTAKILAGVGGLRHTVLSSVIKTDPKRGLELMGEWSILNYGPNTSGIKEWTKRDPRVAAQAVLDNPVGYGARYCLEAIAGVWAEADPAGAMDFAVEATGRLSRELREKLLSEWAGRDLDAASAWLEEQENDTLRDRLSPVIVEAWAKDDPEGALAWCEENLDGHRLMNAVEMLAKGAAAEDPRAAADLVSAMESSPARTQAAVAVAQTWFPQSWPADQTVEPAAIEWISSLGDPVLQAAILDEVSWGWSNQDRESLMEFLTTPHAGRASSRAYHTVMRDFARDDPEGAMEWAANLPANRTVDASTTAFQVWTDHQPAAATDWLMSLPAGDERRPSLVETFVRNASYQTDSVAARRLGRLPAGDRGAAREHIRGLDLDEEKQARLLEALGP